MIWTEFLKWAKNHLQAQLNLTNPPDQSDQTIRPSISIYTDEYGYRYFKYSDNGRITDFEILVEWIPNPLDNIYLNNK